jgi:3-hydroxymyristoyl/3-hydroxydecanoyl-(acyl carrier protein) dehydratase
MRWRLLDRVSQVVAWESARGRKAVSFEEYTLREPFGREGSLPETMVIESCVELLRWLVADSSDFESTCLLEAIAGFGFSGEAGMGDCLDIEATVTSRGESFLMADCQVKVGNRDIANGILRVGLVPMAESFDIAWMRGRWSDLYATA